MKVRTISFTVGRSMPVMPLSGRADDQYASIRPSASVTIEIDSNEASDPTTAAGTETIKKAFDEASTLAFQEMADFGIELRKLYKKGDAPA